MVNKTNISAKLLYLFFYFLEPVQTQQSLYKKCKIVFYFRIELNCIKLNTHIDSVIKIFHGKL